MRHTRPDIDDGICYGCTDLNAASSFEEDAHRVTAALEPFEVLVTSPLQRCRQLANVIGQRFNRESVVDSRIREIDFGRWEGRAWNDIPAAELDAWAADLLHARPHGGESVAMLHKRAMAAMRDYIESGKRHVVVTHSGVIRAVFADMNDPSSFNTAVAFGDSILFEPEKANTDE